MVFQRINWLSKLEPGGGLRTTLLTRSITKFYRRIAGLGALLLIPTWRSGRPEGKLITKDKITASGQGAACVLRFARAKAADFGGDPARVVTVGYSAGGAAGAVMALADELLSS